MRPHGMIWTWAILCTAIAGCSPTTEFRCDDDHICLRDGKPGVCEDTGFCSFPDEDCDSGYRYGELSGDFADTCTPEPPPDEDMDTILDDKDNCKSTPNVDQGNEDGDIFGDVCDLCPVDANNMDRDGDKVGDVCDPHPDTPGDSIEVFEGFHRSLPAGWDKSGEWTAIDGDAQSPSSGRAWLSRPVAAANATVSASMTVGAASPESAVAGLIDNQRPGQVGNSALVCGVALAMGDGSSPGIVLRDATSADQLHPFAWLRDTNYRVKLTHVDNDFTGCEVGGAGPTGTAPSRFDVPQNNPHNAGLFIDAARVRYQWVMIVASP